MSSPSLWLVLVEFGERCDPALERLLARMQCVTGCKLMRVRTDGVDNFVLADCNEALEFSGYQEGLGRVLQSVTASSEVVRVVFINDTLLRSHVRPFARRLLSAMLQRPLPPGACVVGLGMAANEAMRPVCRGPTYFSTWAFALQAVAAKLVSVHFYDADEVLSRFNSGRAACLPEVYRRWMDNWLRPDHLLRGWYKAVPGVPLDEFTYRRKQLGIYLEHRLLPRLQCAGFQPLDIARVPGTRLVNALRRVDRVQVNWLKLRLRLPALLREAYRVGHRRLRRLWQ